MSNTVKARLQTDREQMVHVKTDIVKSRKCDAHGTLNCTHFEWVNTSTLKPIVGVMS